MSTSRLMHVTITASMTTAPSTQGVSLLLMDSTMNRPIPGQAKIVSVVTAPPSREPNWRPTTVIMGISALRSIWTKVTRFSETPLARAVSI